MENEIADFKIYQQLSSEALRRAKQGRAAILNAEREFHEALYRIRNFLPPGCMRDLDKHWVAITEFPSVLRSVLDAQDEANELNAHARHALTMHRIMVEDEKKATTTGAQ